jgi:hypothetical protein
MNNSNTYGDYLKKHSSSRPILMRFIAAVRKRGLDWTGIIPAFRKRGCFYFTFYYLGTSSSFTYTHTAYFYTDNNTWLQGMRESPSVWSAVCVFISSNQGKQED